MLVDSKAAKKNALLLIARNLGGVFLLVDANTAKNTAKETLNALGATSRVWRKVVIRHFVWIVRKSSGRRWKKAFSLS